MSYWIRLPGDDRRHDKTTNLALLAAKAANLARSGTACAIGDGDRYDEPLLRLRPGPDNTVVLAYDGEHTPDWVIQAQRVIRSTVKEHQPA